MGAEKNTRCLRLQCETGVKLCVLLVDKALKLMINQFYICINIFLVKWFVKESSTYNNVQIQYRHDAEPVLSRLDNCNAVLAGLPANSIKPLKIIQNAAATLIFNEPKRTHVTPLFINLHWLPIAARIKFKALMFAYRTTSGSAPLYLNSLLRT